MNDIPKMPTLHISALNVAEAYSLTLDKLLHSGAPAGCQGQETREVLGAAIRVEDPRQCLITAKSRKFNYRYMALEAMWNLCDTRNLDPLRAVNSGITKYVQDQPEHTRDTARWAYGPGIHYHIGPVIQLLKERPDSRRAILRPGRNESPAMRGEGTPPCLEFVQFLVRDSRVHCIVFMRSNDAFMGLPYDMFTYCLWQQAVARALGLEVGSYTHIAGSMHFYRKDLQKVVEASEEITFTDSAGLQSMPDMNEATGPGLLRDVEKVASLLEQNRHTLLDTDIAWESQTWVPLLEAALADWTRKLLWEPALSRLEVNGTGVGW